jgi:hypothetical protein
MRVDYQNNTIYCYYCKRDIKFSEIELNVLYDDSISCKNEHLVGNQEDKEYKFLTAQCSYFYLYHQDTMCRCVQDICKCFGIEDDCENKLGRKSYEEERSNK